MHRFMWVLVLAGCKDDGAAASKAPSELPRQLAGVYPEKWQCDSVASRSALGEVLGGTVRPIDSPMAVPHGVPHPCNYELTLANPPPPPPPATGSGSAAEPYDPHEYWTFDIDCRDGMKQRADALFAQYRETSKQLVEQYAAAHSKGTGSPDSSLAQAKAPKHHGKGKPDDVAATTHPPEPAIDVPVGAKGLDHHGQGLLFIDDDAPCYVRVVGKDGGRRLALAQLLARNLTFANAPMTPRPAH